MFTYIYMCVCVCVYQIDKNWSENENNDLNNEKDLRLNVLFQIWIETIKVLTYPWVA
jgi:hypothetical protein